MSNHDKNFWKRLKDKGYYIALVLCAVAIGVAGLVYYTGQEDIPVEQMESEPVHGQDQGKDAVSVLGTEPKVPRPTVPTLPTEPTVPQVPKSLKTMWPVEGEVVSVFAADKLSYNETTRDWRVHHGIDLTAPAGTPVLAAADGTVYTVYTDDLLGTTVILRHEGGYVTTYASLSQEVFVQAGQTVKMGDKLGTVGQTALTEKALEPHVHFAVRYQETVMDPAEFIGA